MSIELTYSVMEEHIDLLFLEEFFSSTDFQKWFLSNTIGTDNSTKQVMRVEHSAFEKGRESDLEVSFVGNNDITLF